MKLIALVGKSGSGKSEFSKLLIEYFSNYFDKTAIHIDIDSIGHQTLEDEILVKQLEEKIGKFIFDETGKISRSKLSDMVFKNKWALEKLNEITLPKMKELINKLIYSNLNKDYIILDYALLPSIPELFNTCNYKIFIDADIEERKKRIIERDNTSEEKFNQREKASLTYNTNMYDLIIANSDNSIQKLIFDAYATCFHLLKISKEKVAYYPGSFDPITYGHIDIIEKVLKLGFDKIIVAVTFNSSKKNTMFTLGERVEMIKEVFNYNPKIEVITVDSGKASARAAKEYNCSALIRGLRNVTDFEYELNLSKVNATISDVETLFLTASHKYDFVSSSSARELAYLGEGIAAFVPPIIEKRVKDKIKLIK